MTEFQSNNNSIALNILFVENDMEELKQGYIWKHNFSSENKVVLFFSWLHKHKNDSKKVICNITKS